MYFVFSWLLAQAARKRTYEYAEGKFFLALSLATACGITGCYIRHRWTVDSLDELC